MGVATMGVKDMWPILSPAREECTLDSLAGKTLAVDLSGWVCQAQTTKVGLRGVCQAGAGGWWVYWWLGLSGIN